jgi:DNA primase
MARTIPEETIAEIKARADLAGIIGRTVKLRQVGRSLVGLCPFHSEKSPSFNVRPDEGFFYCFGCKAAGDVVSFLERTSGRGFLDIITELAAQTGVELPKIDLDPAEEERQRERKRILRVLELSQVFFRTQLSAEEGKIARAYLTDARKIDDAAIDAFGLGYGGVRDDGLLTFLKEQGVKAEEGVRAGVLARPRDEAREPFDFFRHRVMIPIRGGRGEILSFQGRIFGERETTADGTKRPKYINGPQTVVYDKSSVMFGMFESLPGLKKGTPAVLVEGPLDAMAVHRCGVPSAMAPCGTALTPRHVDEMKRRTKRVVVCMDADKAGRDASERAMLMMLQAGLDVAIVALPDKDPDAMLQTGRADELRGLIHGAPSAVDHQIELSRARARGNAHARSEAVRVLSMFLAAISDETFRLQAEERVCGAVNATREELRRTVAKEGRQMLAQRLAFRPDKSATPAPTKVTAASPSPVPAKMRRQRPRFTEAETLLLESLLLHPHLASRCGVLVDALKNRELQEFLSGLRELLVRFHETDPRELPRRVPIRPSGQIQHTLKRLLDAGAFREPDAFLSEAAAARIVEDAILMLDEHQLGMRDGELERMLALADEREDHPERKRIMGEQAVIRIAIQALRHPGSTHATTRVATVLPAARTAVAVPEPNELREADGGAGSSEPPWAGDPDDDPWAQ